MEKVLEANDTSRTSPETASTEDNVLPRQQFITRKSSSAFLSISSYFLMKGSIYLAEYTADSTVENATLLKDISRLCLPLLGTSVHLLHSIDNPQLWQFIESAALSDFSVSFDRVKEVSGEALAFNETSKCPTQLHSLLHKIQQYAALPVEIYTLSLIVQPALHPTTTVDSYVFSEKVHLLQHGVEAFITLCHTLFVRDMSLFLANNGGFYRGGTTNVWPATWNEAKNDYMFSVLVALYDSYPNVAIIQYYFYSKNTFSNLQHHEWWKKWRSSLLPLLEQDPITLHSYTTRFHSHSIPACFTRTLSTAAENASESGLTGPLSEAFGDSDIAEESSIDIQEPEILLFRHIIQRRVKTYLSVKQTLTLRFHSLIEFAYGYKLFGFNRAVDAYGQPGWIYREWLRNAKSVYLIGDFNNWNRQSHPLHPSSQEDADLYSFEYPVYGAEQSNEDSSNGSTAQNGVWCLFIPDAADESRGLTHRTNVRIQIETSEGEVFDRVPAWSRLAWRNEDTNLFNAVIWSPPQHERYTFCFPRPPRPESPKVYEAHIGIAQMKGGIGTFNDFREVVLPRVARLGYNILLLMAIQEHPLYESFGFHISNFFAPSSRFGTPEEFKQLVDSAHQLGICVLMSIPHSHASRSVLDGLNRFDGTDTLYFRTGMKHLEEPFKAKFFDYRKLEVLRFLLSNLLFFIVEYGIDGFRFENTTSMIFHDFGVGKQYSDNLEDYFGKDVNEEAIVFLMLANDLIHTALPENGLTLTDEFTVFPLLCHPPRKGGLGFDYRYASEGWQKWMRSILSNRDEDWDLKDIVSYMLHPRISEKCILSIEDAMSERIGRRPLKIALFAWESLHTHAIGGVAPHVTELAAALNRIGHEVHVFVRATTSTGLHQLHLGVHYHECSFTLDPSFVVETRNMCNSFIWFMRQTEVYMKTNFHICHAHDWLAAQVLKQCKELGRVCILTMHSTEFGRCGNNAYGGISKQIRDIESEACYLADRVICVSNVLATEVLSQYSIHREKIRVIYNGIHSEQYDGYEDSGRLKLSYAMDVMAPMFLFVGRLVVQKGPDLLIEAIPYILKFRQDANFVIVGDGHMRHALEERVRHLGIQHAVRIVGVKSGHELKSLFKACDAVAIPSRNEPFGIVVLEAWAAGKPVVATTCGGPRDFVSHNVDGYLVEPNPGSIAWGCCEIMKNFEHSQWMGSRGRVKAAYNFSWNTVGTQVADVYYEQLNRHDAPPTLLPLGDLSLASTLMGKAIHDHMSLFDDNEYAFRGLALHKMLRLFVCGLAGSGYLNFMGNEFAHPNWVDMPRGGNAYSFAFAQRQWNLPDSTHLKFKHFELFDACMIHMEDHLRWLRTTDVLITECCNEKKILAFERGICLIVFNFHPIQSYEGYRLGGSFVGPLKLVLTTDEYRFGGLNRLDKTIRYPRLGEYNGRPYSFKLYLPARTAMIFIPFSEYEQSHYCKDEPLYLQDADGYIASLSRWRLQH